MRIDHTEALELALEEIEKLKHRIRSERMLTALSSEYTSFGLWEYDIESDTYSRIKKFNGIYFDEPETIPHFRETLTGHGQIVAEDLPEFNRFCDSLKRGDSEVFCVVRVIGEAPGIVTLRIEGKVVLDDDGEPYKFVGRTIDITAEKDSADNNYGKRDPLTGLYAPELFRENIAQKRSGINRYNNGAFLSVGVDKFRDIEAIQGREYSDYVQKSIAHLIENIIQAERDCAVTRIRSGEFLVYLSYIDVNAPDKIARRILDNTNSFEFSGVRATVSIGIARMRSGRRLEDVYSKAALALGEAQKSGGNCFMHYSITMSSGQTAPGTYDRKLSGGAQRVYELILRAFTNERERPAIMRKAFAAAGEFIGASNIYVYSYEDREKRCEMLYDATGLSPEECPGIEQHCSDNDISAIFGDGDSLRLHTADDKITGLSLENGAVCAECRAVRFKGRIIKFFAVIFNSRFELTEQDLRVITELHEALCSMTREYEDSKSEKTVSRLNGMMISDHRMEGFSIIPGTFVVETVEDNIAEHYDMRCGDICYKKIYGRDEPCENCPALKLDSSGGMFAASPYYNKKENRWLDVTASVTENEKAERRYVVSYTDITDCLGKIQNTDPLTGVMTFDAFTAEVLHRTAGKPCDDVYIAVISLAEFRRINERHGFEIGNSILIAMAEIFNSCLKKDELVCRSNASRFVVMFKERDSNEMFMRISSILGSMQKQVLDRFKIQIYIVAGVCCPANEDVGVMGALDKAVTAKNTVSDRPFYSRNHIVFYDGTLSEQLKERRHIEANMMSALENSEFKVYYQPKVNINTGKVVGAEALVRWIRPDGEIIPPGRFIPIFEQNGFITDMDFSIYRSAVADISRWLRMGIDVPLISLNVSRYHLCDENFIEKLCALVDNLGVPHKYIELEITESLLTEQLEKLVDTVTMLKDRGFKISVDDFGSGYSSLNLITMLPFDTLKIDGAFFLKNDLTERNKKVITSVVTLAKSLNLETVSEGVETHTQVEFLRKLGCDLIQGFFYYKPMPCRDFEQLLLKGRK